MRKLLGRAYRMNRKFGKSVCFILQTRGGRIYTLEVGGGGVSVTCSMNVCQALWAIKYLLLFYLFFDRAMEERITLLPLKGMINSKCSPPQKRCRNYICLITEHTCVRSEVCRFVRYV